MDNKNRLISFSLTLAVILLASTIYYGTKSATYENYIQSANERAYSQLIDSVTALDSSLQKIKHANPGPMLNTLAAQIYRESGLF